MDITVFWGQGSHSYRFENGEIHPVDISIGALGEPLLVRFFDPSAGVSVDLPGSFWSYVTLDRRIAELCRVLSMPNAMGLLQAIALNLHGQDRKQILSVLPSLLLEVSGGPY